MGAEGGRGGALTYFPIRTEAHQGKTDEGASTRGEGWHLFLSRRTRANSKRENYQTSSEERGKFDGDSSQTNAVDDHFCGSNETGIKAVYN